jgi:hypothetical protein
MSNQNNKKALVIITDGSEEMEAVISSVYFIIDSISLRINKNLFIFS